jgi:DNA polymerase
MLEAMGIRLWQREAVAPPPASAEGDAAPRPAHRAGPAVVSQPAHRADDDASPPTGRADAATRRPIAPRAVPPARPPLAPAAASADAAPGASGRVVGVESMDWPQLREAVASCTACRLHTGRRHTVFGVGHEHAHWMIVGEAPGEQEDRQGEPFVGKAGQLLDQMLHAVGLTRLAAPPERQVFIANTLKCRPPGNRNPQPDELACCEPFLIRQVALVRPRIILAMGRFAVQSLLRSDEPIGRLRGRVHRYEGVPLVVTYHPAYLLRNPIDKAKSWEDLCLALDVVGGATPAP